MAVIKYKDKNGNWKTLTETVNVSGDTSGVYVGNEEPVNPNCKVWYDTSYSPTPVAKCKLANGEWAIIAGGGSGNASGGITNAAEFTITNTTPWVSKTVAYGASVNATFTWSSKEGEKETGDGTVTISVNGVSKKPYDVKQGDISVKLGEHLVPGENKIEITISDIYGNGRLYKFNIETVSIKLDSYFGKTLDGSDPESCKPHKGDITYSYITEGRVKKTVYFLVDGKLNGTQEISSSGETETYVIKEYDDEGNHILSHGRHSLEVYFDCVIDGQTVPSDHLIYDLICYDDKETDSIVASAYKIDAVKQYSTIVIPWVAFTPGKTETTVTIAYKAGNYTKSTTRTVDRTQQTYSYRAEIAEDTEITFSVDGEVKKRIEFEVDDYDFKFPATTSNLELHLTASGRSNQDKNIPLREWRDPSGIVRATLNDKFNFVSNGWLTEDGNDFLRVSGEARVDIDHKIFTSDILTSGKTIEFEFATRDVLNPDAIIISCWDEKKGIKITAHEAMLKSAQNTVSRQYKENTRTRVAFTIQKAAEHKLVSLYINGVESNTIQYASGQGGDDFSQASPVGISIGSSECTTDIYCIRVYRSNLTRRQVLSNWIADTQDIDERLAKEERNDVFDDYGISVDKVDSKNIPYLVITHIRKESDTDYQPVTSLSQFPQAKRKGNEPKRYAKGYYVDPLHPERSFAFEDAEIDVQGTSSEGYPRKNYKIKFKKGFTIDNKHHDTYALRETSVPTDVFTFKTDYASSEGANNVELVMLYDEVNPERTPPQKVEGSKVRQGIEGYPCLMFYSDGAYNYFIGKYNFNNDKGTEEVFGFSEGDESWEIRNNNDTAGLGAWKSDDYSNGKWRSAFEARYPEEDEDEPFGDEAVKNLQRFASWLKSTDTTVVDSKEAKQARIDKFRNEFSRYANVRAWLFNYSFTEAFLMVDNRRKNLFPTMYQADGKWIPLPYDFDTAIGINNNGELKFGYWLEDTDVVDESAVYNDGGSVLYTNIRLAFSEELKGMYQEIRGHRAFNYEAIEKRFADHQSVWGEAIFNEDSRFKYIEPLINDGTNELAKLQGSKESQRQWWLYNRFRYLDSKYNTGDSVTDKIRFYAYYKEDLEITPYADIYASALFDSKYNSTRALRAFEEDGETLKSYTVENPMGKGEAKDHVIDVYSASQLASLGDLSKFKIGWADFTNGKKLLYLKLGSDVDENGVKYNNEHLRTLTVGNLELLTSLDIRNCSEFRQVVDVSGCKNIKTVLCEGTKATGVILPNGGVLETLHLPETITGLTIRNQRFISDFSVENNNISDVDTLWLEYVDWNLFDIVELLGKIQPNSRVRLIGIDLNIDTAEEIFALYDMFNTFRGLDESNQVTDIKEAISGTIHCGTITGAELLEMQTRYPNITIDYKHITSNVYFYVDRELVHTAIVLDGGDCYDPIEIIGTPSIKPTATTQFDFVGWDNNLKNVTADRIVNAVFDEVPRRFTIKFVDWNDDVLKSQVLGYGSDVLPPDDPTREGYDFIGWDKSIVAVNDDVTYKAQYKIKTFTITWKVDNKVMATYNDVAYGTTLTLPYAVGESFALDGVTYRVKSYSPSIAVVTSDATYTASAVAVKTATAICTARPTAFSDHNYSTTTGMINFINNQQPYDMDGLKSPTAETKIYFYGFNFADMRSKNVKRVTGMNLFGKSKAYKTGSSYIERYKVTAAYQTNGNTDLGDGFFTLLNNSDKAITDKSYSTYNVTNSPNALNWINANLSSVLNDYTSTVFGVRLVIMNATMNDLTLTLTYEYEYEEEV